MTEGEDASVRVSKCQIFGTDKTFTPHRKKYLNFLHLPSFFCLEYPGDFTTLASTHQLLIRFFWQVHLQRRWWVAMTEQCMEHVAGKGWWATVIPVVLYWTWVPYCGHSFKLNVFARIEVLCEMHEQQPNQRKCCKCYNMTNVQRPSFQPHSSSQLN